MGYKINSLKGFDFYRLAAPLSLGPFGDFKRKKNHPDTHIEQENKKPTMCVTVSN